MPKHAMFEVLLSGPYVTLKSTHSDTLDSIVGEIKERVSGLRLEEGHLEAGLYKSRLLSSNSRIQDMPAEDWILWYTLRFLCQAGWEPYGHFAASHATAASEYRSFLRKVVK